MPRSQPQTSLFADLFLLLVAAKSLADLAAAGYLQGLATQGLYLMVVPIALGIFFGLRSPVVAGVTRVGLLAAAWIAWGSSLLYLDRPGFELVVALLLVLLAAYSVTSLVRFGLSWGLALAILAGLALATCRP